jgi:hypothetical protein
VLIKGVQRFRNAETVQDKYWSARREEQSSIQHWRVHKLVLQWQGKCREEAVSWWEVWSLLKLKVSFKFPVVGRGLLHVRPWVARWNSRKLLEPQGTVWGFHKKVNCPLEKVETTWSSRPKLWRLE